MAVRCGLIPVEIVPTADHPVLLQGVERDLKDASGIGSQDREKSSSEDA